MQANAWQSTILLVGLLFNLYEKGKIISDENGATDCTVFI